MDSRNKEVKPKQDTESLAPRWQSPLTSSLVVTWENWWKDPLRYNEARYLKEMQGVVTLGTAKVTYYEVM